MIDGTYKIGVDTPFGRKEGTIVVRMDGDAAIADIDAPIVGKRHLEGHAEGDTFTAEGSGKIKLVGMVSYILEGEVRGDILRVNIHSNKGDFALEGARV